MKKPFSMLLDIKLWKRLDKESKRLKLSKVKIVSIALDQLFKSGKLEIYLD